MRSGIVAFVVLGIVVFERLGMVEYGVACLFVVLVLN